MAKKIEHIFLDTSLFIKENFLEGKRIKSIFSLASKGYFKLYFSIITIEEVKNQYKKRITGAIEKHNQLINDKTNDIRVLRNNKSGKDILRKFPKANELCLEFNELLSDSISEAGATILDYPILNIKGVFEDYFLGRSPFGGADKKAEFPDAFALAHIACWAADHKSKAIILTQDKDFTKHTYGSVVVDHEYEKYVQDKLKLLLEDRISLLEKIYDEKSEQIDKEILDWVQDQLWIDSTYDNAVNYMDIHEISIEELEIVSKSYEIIGVESDKIDDQYIYIEVMAHVRYKVALNIDDEETGIWDSEDKVMLWRETKDLTLSDDDLKIPVKIFFEIVDAEEYDDEPQIDEINNSKGLNIDGPDYYY